MSALSSEVEHEIQRHMATGHYESVDQLLIRALQFLSQREDFDRLGAFLLDCKKSGFSEQSPTFFADAMEAVRMRIRETATE